MSEQPENIEPFDSLDPVQQARQRMEEDAAIQAEMERMNAQMGEDPMDRLRSRRRQLKDELHQLDSELGEGSVHRAWLRKLPDWFWFPSSVVHDLMTSQVASKQSHNNPTIYHWVRHADLTSCAINTVLWLVFLAGAFALIGMLV